MLQLDGDLALIYDGYTMDIQLIYGRYTVDIQWKYDRNTVVIFVWIRKFELRLSYERCQDYQYAKNYGYSY